VDNLQLPAQNKLGCLSSSLGEISLFAYCHNLALVSKFYHKSIRYLVLLGHLDGKASADREYPRAEQRE
jgi:hypothetical protein